jgi:putative addiction module component (TIGR02574 family)
MSVDSAALSSEAQQLFEAAMKLPEPERAKLADKLAMTVDPMADPEWQAAWGPEIARRIAEVENGTAKLHDWEDVRRRLWEGLDAPPGT